MLHKMIVPKWEVIYFYVVLFQDFPFVAPFVSHKPNEKWETEKNTFFLIKRRIVCLVDLTADDVPSNWNEFNCKSFDSRQKL